MNCPNCKSEQVKVVDSRPLPKEVKRRRECLDCGFRFNTIEITDKVVMQMSKPWENSEGYPDFTAYHGINNAMAEGNLMDKTISCVIGTLKGVARLAGFDIVGRIVLRDIETGRVYR